MIVAAFHGDERPVLARPGTQFYNYVCGDEWPDDQECIGTIDEFVISFFGGKFQYEHLWYDIFSLAVFLVSARVLTFFALKYLNYSGK